MTVLYPNIQSFYNKMCYEVMALHCCIVFVYFFHLFFKEGGGGGGAGTKSN